MSKHKSKILAIDPGTREMGIAFLEGEKLIYHGVSVIKGELPHDKLAVGRKIILRLIKDFKPHIGGFCINPRKGIFQELYNQSVYYNGISDSIYLGLSDHCL